MKREEPWEGDILVVTLNGSPARETIAPRRIRVFQGARKNVFRNIRAAEQSLICSENRGNREGRKAVFLSGSGKVNLGVRDVHGTNEGRRKWRVQI